MCGIGRQEHGGLPDLFRRSEPLQGNALLVLVGNGLVRGQPTHALGVGDGTGRDAVDSNAKGAPFECQGPGEHVDAGFRGTDVTLHRHGHEGLRCRNVDDRGARLLQVLECRPQHVKRAEQVDIDNGFETVRRHIVGEGRKVARGAGHQDVDIAGGRVMVRQSALYRLRVADVERIAACIGTQ